jgi:signal transduction histidine kinase
LNLLIHILHFHFIEILKERYPTINIVEVDSIKDGLEMVAKGELFGFVDTLPTVGYILQQDYNAQLKIAGKFSDSWELAIAVRKEFSQLTYIFNKAIRAIPESENQQIINNWISVKYEESLDLETITKLFALFLIILALIYLKYVVTKRYNKHLEDEVRRQLEELRKKDIALINQNKLASMGEMVGSIAHQWKQPLNVLHLNIEMLIDDYEDGLIDENFINDFRDKNIDIIKFMVTTIDDFRNFFRVEKVKKDFDVKAGVETIINMQKNYLNKRNISISLKGDGFKTHGFLTEFQQVILNLINNAKDEFVKKEMKNGKVEVILSKEDGTIRVHDNAGGVPEDIINKIFDPYFTTKDIGEGTGIGLHMSKTIVEDHLDGKISVVNRDGGAEFIIYLKAVN